MNSRDLRIFGLRRIFRLFIGAGQAPLSSSSFYEADFFSLSG